MKAGARGQAGLGLMEVLVAMVIFGIISSSVLYFLGGQGTAATLGGDLTKGAHLGKQKLDSLKIIDYRDIASGSDTVQAHYIRSWRVSTSLGRKNVQMNVYWPLSAGHSLTLYTIIGDDQYKLQ